MERGLEKRCRCRPAPPWGPHRSVSVFVVSLMAAHGKIQIGAFQIVGLGAKRNDILVSQDESIKPRVLETET